MTAQQTYDTVADFIASMNPKMLLSLSATPEMQARLEELLYKSKQSGLSLT
ncbi:MAG: hypothetical protein HC912_05230 [Saprospiraceae bacterium]|nr:hypothetical protein [Saprospiraceae bacterium]